METVFSAVMFVFLCLLWIAAGIAAIQMIKAFFEYENSYKEREKARQEKARQAQEKARQAQEERDAWKAFRLSLSSSSEDNDEDDYGYDM